MRDQPHLALDSLLLYLIDSMRGGLMRALQVKFLFLIVKCLLNDLLEKYRLPHYNSNVNFSFKTHSFSACSSSMRVKTGTKLRRRNGP